MIVSKRIIYLDRNNASVLYNWDEKALTLNKVIYKHAKGDIATVKAKIESIGGGNHLHLTAFCVFRIILSYV